MLNLLLKNTLRKVIVKIATDKSFRGKAKTIFKNTKELSDKGQLMKTLGKSAGRLKNKIKKEL